jgi:cyclopropane-fatty-acyl-phospholipid synthase
MKINKNTIIPLDKFIEFALYDKDTGYYMKKRSFWSRR